MTWLYETNVQLRGPYGYALHPTQQIEERTYILESGELVRVRCRRLTPSRYPEQIAWINTPSGKYLLIRNLLPSGRVRVDITDGRLPAALAEANGENTSGQD